MRRTRHIVLPVKSWQYMGLMVVSLACLTLGLVSRDRGGRSESLAGPELQHTAPHEVDACPNFRPLGWMSRYDETAFQNGPNDYSGNAGAPTRVDTLGKSLATLDKEKSAIRNRRSIAIDRRVRTVDTSRLRNDRTDRLGSESSRIREVRRNPSSTREQRNRVNAYRSDKTDQRARQSNRWLEPDSVRSSSSRSQELREEPNYRSSHNERRYRAVTDYRSDRSRKQRLNSRPNDHRSHERRDDRITRSFVRRSSDSDRADRSNRVSRRVVRSINSHDKSSRSLRSWNDRMEQKSEHRRSSRTHGQSDFVLKRADASRSATRQLVQHERRDRSIVDRSSKPISAIARTRSADSRRVSDVPSQNRRYVEELKKDSRRREAHDFSRSPVSRQSSHRIESTRVRSVARNSFERRITNPTQYRTMRIDLMARSRDAQGSRLPVSDRSDARHVEVRSGDRRTVAQPDFARAERRASRISPSERRLHQERQRRSADRSQTRRLVRWDEPNRLERRRAPLSTRSEERRSSGSEVREPLARLDSLRRETRTSRARAIPVPGERAATRFVSNDRRTSSVHLRQRRASSLDLPRLRLGSVSSVVDSRRRELFAIDGHSRPSLHRGRQIVSRRLQTPDATFRTSPTSQARRASRMDSMEWRSARNSRHSRTGELESFKPVAIRHGTDQRRASSAERPNTRKFRSSQERRAASTIEELARTSGRKSLLKNGRISGTSSLTREARDLLNELPAAREVRTSSERRGLSATRLERRQTSGFVSLQRNSRGSETSRKVGVKLRERIAAPLERRGRSAAITRALGESRAQDGAGPYRKYGKTFDNEIRVARSENTRRIFEKRSLMRSFTNGPDLNIGKISEAKTREYPHQILLLVLCAIYGASSIKGKDGSHSIGNVVAPWNRFVVW